MSQSGFILACLLGGFVIYLAANNKLAAYRTILWDGSSSSNSNSSSTSNKSSGGVSGAIESGAKVAQSAADLAGLLGL